MGMDLKPINPDKHAPKSEWSGDYEWGRYNWTGWTWLIDLLAKYGWTNDDLKEFAGTNDGYVISDETCKKVAKTLREHRVTIGDKAKRDLLESDWVDHQILLWETCGGYEQW